MKSVKLTISGDGTSEAHLVKIRCNLSKPSPNSLHEVNSLNAIITFSFFRTRNVFYFKLTVNREGYPLERGITDKNLFLSTKIAFCSILNRCSQGLYAKGSFSP